MKKQDATNYKDALEAYEAHKEVCPDASDRDYVFGFMEGSRSESRRVIKILKQLVTAKALLLPSDVGESDLYLTIAALQIIEELEK